MAEYRRSVISVYFDVEGEGVLETERSAFRPTSAHVKIEGDGEATVWVRGPILRADGHGLSRRSALLVYGKFGGGFGRAPQWVRELVDRVRRMESFDNGEGES